MMVKEHKDSSSSMVNLTKQLIFDSDEVQVCNIIHTVFHYCHGYVLR